MNLVRQAIIENRIHVFKNAFPILPSWDTLLPIISDFVDDDLKVFPVERYDLSGNLEEEYLDHRLKYSSSKFPDRSYLSTGNLEEEYFNL